MARSSDWGSIVSAATRLLLVLALAAVALASITLYLTRAVLGIVSSPDGAALLAIAAVLGMGWALAGRRADG